MERKKKTKKTKVKQQDLTKASGGLVHGVQPPGGLQPTRAIH